MFRHLVRLIFALMRWLLQMAWRLFRLIGSLIFTSITSLFVGVPQSVDRISDSWINQATEVGIPVGQNQGVRIGIQIVAVIMLVLGWMAMLGLFVLFLSFLWN